MSDRRTALITGASAGLGAEFSRQLAAQGHDLVLVARRESRLRELAEELAAAHGVRVEVLAADLTDPTAPQKLHEQVEARNLSIDVLVNNAGCNGGDLLGERDWSQHAAFFELMMTSVAHMCHRFVPGMQARGYGRVINVASMAGRIARAGGCMYGPSKSFVIALSESLWATLRGSGVHVCALCPGFTHTEFHDVAGTASWKESSPDWIWYSAQTVVKEGLAAVEANKPIHASGLLYRLMDPFTQSVLTRGLIRSRAKSPAKIVSEGG